MQSGLAKLLWRLSESESLVFSPNNILLSNVLVKRVVCKTLNSFLHENQNLSRLKSAFIKQGITLFIIVLGILSADKKYSHSSDLTFIVSIIMWVIFWEPISILYISSFMAAHFETEDYTVLRCWQHKLQSSTPVWSIL